MENIKVNNNNGIIANMTQKERRQSFKRVAEERLGETRMMNCGELAFIVEYVNNKNITVQFKSTSELVKITYEQFKKGNVKSHFSPSVYGVGITGLENIKDKNGDTLRSYKTWFNMLRRCYSDKALMRNPTYIGCTICEEWKLFSNFKKWYDENYYEVQDERMDLDKDILHKGNKIYSPNTCVFVPQFINTLFTKCNVLRGDLPIGVSLDNSTNKYKSQCGIFDIVTGKSKQNLLGMYNTIEEAFNAYKIAKEQNIKEMADYYKEEIPSQLYEAMYDYTVSIND